MARFLRYEVHPDNPQSRLLQSIALQLRGGAVAALPTAAGYGLACRLDDKLASDRLRRHADRAGRAPVGLLCRDLAQAANYLQIGNHAFRVIRAALDGTQSFALPSTRRLPRRLVGSPGAVSLLHFSGHVAAQGLMALLDEPLLIGLPSTVASDIEQLPSAWQLDVALDVGALPAAGAVEVVDLHGLLQPRPGLSRWQFLEPALA
ncbi:MULTISPECIES: Sua5/YciO/YrdC/YwlC family protein [unclassified Roseateles]|uniref:Sua5/YciO/YrdC/YwlC family protein n=1 Tax=unclassified Roseateles TaxID=2626991 RepID=UPI0006F33FE2|nr:MULTISPECIES: Sua5/YciO/YrdC/YwlC family protein [unclassified Roseateles]KQW52072.1 hypothetical protein ASC81_05615 [Pelomonas sp. Root405]KRA78306.1 hypothetical protein ASD88_05620 [Pelomonas sp. Root662]